MHMHIGKKITSCTYLHLKREFHAIIYSFRKRPQAIFVDMGTFSKRLLMLLILKYAYVERHFLLLIHTLQGILCHIFTYIHTPLKGVFHATHIHTHIHTIERYFLCYLDAKYPSWGQPNS